MIIDTNPSEKTVNLVPMISLLHLLSPYRSRSINRKFSKKKNALLKPNLFIISRSFRKAANLRAIGKGYGGIRKILGEPICLRDSKAIRM